MHAFDTQTIEHLGQTVRIDYFYDDCADYPWQRADGHGPVRRSRYSHSEGHSDKRPGEVPLNRTDRNQWQFYYDWQAAMKAAKKEHWNTAPYDAPNKALRAVQSDFDFLRAYLAQEWGYVGIVCTLLDDEGGDTGESDSCWGFETFKDYHLEAGQEMARELCESASKEAENVAYWASRDVVTVEATA